MKTRHRASGRFKMLFFLLQSVSFTDLFEFQERVFKMIFQFVFFGEVMELIFLFEIKDPPREIGQGFVGLVLHDYLQCVDPGFAKTTQ